MWPTLAGHLKDHPEEQRGRMKQVHAPGEASPEQQVFLTRMEGSVPRPNNGTVGTPIMPAASKASDFQQVLRKNSLSTTEAASPLALNGGLGSEALGRLAWTRSPSPCIDIPPGQFALSCPELSCPWEPTRPFSAARAQMRPPAHLHALQECLGVLDALRDTLLVLWEGFQFLHQRFQALQLKLSEVGPLGGDPRGRGASGRLGVVCGHRRGLHTFLRLIRQSPLEEPHGRCFGLLPRGFLVL